MKNTVMKVVIVVVILILSYFIIDQIETAINHISLTA